MKTTRSNRFSKTNQPTTCSGCGKRTTNRVQGSSTDLCRTCFEAAGLENEHRDVGHSTPVSGCPICALH